MHAPSRRTLLGLGIVTASTLMLQVIVTRLFSAVLAYHFSFLAISLALSLIHISEPTRPY